MKPKEYHEAAETAQRYEYPTNIIHTNDTFDSGVDLRWNILDQSDLQISAAPLQSKICSASTKRDIPDNATTIL